MKMGSDCCLKSNEPRIRHAPGFLPKNLVFFCNNCWYFWMVFLKDALHRIKVINLEKQVQ